MVVVGFERPFIDCTRKKSTAKADLWLLKADSSVMSNDEEDDDERAEADLHASLFFGHISKQ